MRVNYFCPVIVQVLGPLAMSFKMDNENKLRFPCNCSSGKSSLGVVWDGYKNKLLLPHNFSSVWSSCNEVLDG